MSVVVKMEENDNTPTYAHPEPIPTTTIDMNTPPPLSINHRTRSRTTASASTSRENYRKLDTAGRRQLRAQLRGSAEADKRLMCTYEKVVVSDNPISSTASLEAAENGESIYARRARVEFAGEGLASTTTMTSTDSQIEIARNGDKMSIVTNTSRSSDTSKIGNEQQQDQLRCGTDSTDIETEDSDEITKACNSFMKSWKQQLALTPEERSNRYRFSENVEPLYLGFYPRASDKRKYLKAYPIVGPIPDGKLSWGCSMPMTVGQWIFVIGLVILFTGLGLGVYFYVRTRL